MVHRLRLTTGMSEVRIFTRCRQRLVNQRALGVGAVVVHADWPALDSLWVAPTSTPPPPPLSEIVVQMLQRVGKRTWRPERVVRATGGGTAGVEDCGGPAVNQHVGRLDPVC
jgi:hypothetical protein